MHLFLNNMADPDISDYEFDADDLFQQSIMSNKRQDHAAN
jgi:hypothetical protein